MVSLQTAFPGGANDRRPVGRKPLPCGFLWGVSTSAYQVEGAAQADGRGASIWDGFCREPGRIANGDTGDEACDHYHRYREDIGLMQQIGVGAYRFSVAWPRILPTGRSPVNEAGIAFYDRLVDGLLQAGIEPWLCLYHWDLPQALQELGGWTNRDVVEWFSDYAQVVARRLGDRVKRFATFNEPAVFTLFGYSFGWHPPATNDHDSLYAAVHHVNLAHGTAVDVLRAEVAAASIGVIHNMQPSRPVQQVPADRKAAAILDDFWNRAFPDPQLLGDYPASLRGRIDLHRRKGDMERICRPVDWLGVNHYSPIYAKAEGASPLGFAWADAPADVVRSPVGWQIDPMAFRDVLLDAHDRYGLPLYVTENGAGAVEKPDASGEILDLERVDYFSRYINALGEAVELGADVRGYFVWSLLDNFEWGAGYQNRFGLVYVDYPTQRRVPKASARWYAATIKAAAERVAT
ncbi:MAG: GH1 family beta-glucosidase [Reyranella sp.]|uniref:GH1 family beta-glucosidase n=1 Tax=Reyranella sp. TaxID=1929291 RepID=UPI003D095B59